MAATYTFPPGESYEIDFDNDDVAWLFNGEVRVRCTVDEEIYNLTALKRIHKAVRNPYPFLYEGLLNDLIRHRDKKKES